MVRILIWEYTYIGGHFNHLPTESLFTVAGILRLGPYSGRNHVKISDYPPAILIDDFHGS
jgi:hypothetical protein